MYALVSTINDFQCNLIVDELKVFKFLNVSLVNLL